MRTPLFVANWKMNQTATEADGFFRTFPGSLRDVVPARAHVALAPQAIQLAQAAAALKGTSVGVAAQNCGQTAWGAYTGENSPVALHALGVQWVILGHSERRWVYHEDSHLIQARMKAALEAGLAPILCVGERLVDRKEGKTFTVLEEQLAILKGVVEGALDRFVLAYEPVWAIGTGETASPQQAQEAHAFIRQWMHDRFAAAASESIRILYGGSAKPDNAAALMAQKDVDGLLVGGASLNPMAFAELVRNGVRSQA